LTQEQFDLIEEQIAPYRTAGRTDSAAQLAWFLENVWRMEPEDVSDAICDGSGDKGIDAIDVDDDLREITILQSKHRETVGAGQGDQDLRNLVGAAAYFESPEAVDRLLRSRPNPELTRLLQRLDIRQKVADGAHAARLVFVTNAFLDPAGQGYVEAVADRDPPLDVWDRERLAAVAVRAKRPELRADRIELTATAPPTQHTLDGDVKIAIALVSGQQLVALPGLDDLTLFDPNVRLGLGRTRINKDLEATVLTPEEHALFPAYHNGLTMLTHRLEVDGNTLVLEGISVVNGCQSLLTLHQHQQALSDPLTLLVKVIQVDEGSSLPEKITYRTNNQNSVDIRDQRSRDPIQRELQAHVAEVFGQDFGYSIRRGESIDANEVLGNETAAQLIMAFYVNEPWNAVRKVRLFDEEYRRIFNRSIDAHKLYLLHLIAKVIEGTRPNLRADLASSFASVRFTIAYLLVQVLRESDLGKQLVEEPERWLPDLRDAVVEALTALAEDVVVSINFFVETREQEAVEKDEIFDAKVIFKSQSGVRDVEHELIRTTRHVARRNAEYLFTVEPVRRQ